MTPNRIHILNIVFWGALALFLSILAIAADGQGLPTGGAAAVRPDLDIPSYILGLETVLTPCLIVVLIGVYRSRRRWNALESEERRRGFERRVRERRKEGKS